MYRLWDAHREHGYPPSCGGINFYPLADEVPGDDPGTVKFEIDVDAALEQLDAEES